MVVGPIVCLTLAGGIYDSHPTSNPEQDQVKVLSAFGAAGPRRLPRPTELRIDVATTEWAGAPNVAFTRTDTIRVLVRPGDDLDGPRDHGWNNGPLFLGAIIDSRNAWVRFTGGLVPQMERRPATDSILVSTVWRSFYTPSYDAGFFFKIRIVPLSGWGSGMQVIPRPVEPRQHASAEGASRAIGHNQVRGSLRRSDSGKPMDGAWVSLQDLPLKVKSSAAGTFEFSKVPIGHQVLVVRDAYGEMRATIEVSDEKQQNLDVVVSCPGPAEVGESSSEPPSWSGPVDVWPLRITEPPPVYPPEARPLGLEGDVHVRAWIDSIGVVRSTSIDHSVSSVLDASALESVRKSRFRPALAGGRPIGCPYNVAVHFEHPKSRELIAPANRGDSAKTSRPGQRGTDAFAVVVSAQLDSITGLYSYSYRFSNLGRQTLIAAFSLLPIVGEIEDFGSPQGWNGFSGCGGRYDVIGSMVHGNSRNELWDQMMLPGERLTGFSFKSPHPPGKVRWFAQAMSRDSALYFPWFDGPRAADALAASPLQGTTMGPVPRRKASR